MTRGACCRQRERFFLAQTVEMPSATTTLATAGPRSVAGPNSLFTPSVRSSRRDDRRRACGALPPSLPHPVSRICYTRQSLDDVRRAVDTVTISVSIGRYIRDVLVAIRFHHMTLFGATLRATEDVFAAVRYAKSPQRDGRACNPPCAPSSGL